MGELRTYVVAIVLTAGPGALMVATMLNGRFRRLSLVPLNSIYAVVTLSLAGLGVLALNPNSFLPLDHDWLAFTLSIVAAPALGQVVVAADGGISDALRRRSRRSRGAAQPPSWRGNLRVASGMAPVRVTSAGAASQLATRRRDAAPRASGGRVPHEVQSRRRTLLWLILVAVGEELLYRGVFVNWALLCPPSAASCFLVLSTAVFALIHISFGWSQVLAKLPLALVALATTLAFGSPLCAVLLHVHFNVFYWRKRRFSALSAAATAWTV